LPGANKVLKIKTIKTLFSAINLGRFCVKALWKEYPLLRAGNGKGYCSDHLSCSAKQSDIHLIEMDDEIIETDGEIKKVSGILCKSLTSVFG